LKAAQREMDESNARMHDLHQADEHHYLSPQAAQKRAETLKRIYEQKTLLQNFVDSPLLGSVAKYLEEESAQQAANAAAQQAATAQGKAAPDLNQKAKERLAKIMSPTRRALMTQEEIERHKANMRTAITQLVEKIDEVVSVL
jgi:pyruvate/2-oxoglutarate dehydrogenase complex dihydrolipoamide acyltransferase (E2) component